MRRRIAIMSAVAVIGALASLFAGMIRPLSAAVDRPPPALAAVSDRSGDAPLRIVAFGTSLTAGGPWPERLAHALSACSGRSVTMDRVAAPGMGSRWALGEIQRVADLSPHVILLEFAINDADLIDGVSLGRSRRQHEALLEALATAMPDTRVVLMTMNPVQGIARNLQRPRLGAYYRVYRDLSERHDVGLADLAPRWRARAADLPRHPDGLHPAPEAAEAVIVPVLVDLLGPVVSRPDREAAAGCSAG